MDNMFMYCSNLSSITFPSNFGHKVVNSYGTLKIFDNCNKLTEIYGDLALSVNFVLNNGSISHDSLVRVLNSIQTLSESKTLTLGSTNLAKLTDEEKQIAIDKGWTLA